MRITRDIWETMADHLGMMLVATIVTILFGLMQAWALHKLYEVDVTTSIFSNIPGGLSEMVTIGREQGGNLQIISMFHSIRIVTVVFVTPYVVTMLSHKPNLLPVQTGSQVVGWVQAAALLAAGALGAVAAARLKIPAPYFLGPLLTASVVSFALSFTDGSVGTATPALSGLIVKGAQLLIGAGIGIEFKREEIRTYRRLFVVALAASLLLTTLTFTLALLLSYATGIDLLTGMLATAAGGAAEMSLTALAIGADPLLVTAFQLFRVMFIVTVFSFSVRWFLKRRGLCETANRQAR
jgi:membrane AbrB-like protein